MPTEERLRELGETYLTEKGQVDLDQKLVNEEYSAAARYLLGAIDGLWNRDQISDDEAADVYRELGIDPEEASRLRQQHTRTH